MSEEKPYSKAVERGVLLACIVFILFYVMASAQATYFGNPLPWLPSLMNLIGFGMFLLLVWQFFKLQNERDRLKKLLADKDKKPKTSYDYKDGKKTEGKYHADLKPPDKGQS